MAPEDWKQVWGLAKGSDNPQPHRFRIQLPQGHCGWVIDDFFSCLITPKYTLFLLEQFYKNNEAQKSQKNKNNLRTILLDFRQIKGQIGKNKV